LARQVALIREIHHQSLNREDVGQFLRLVRGGIAGQDHIGMVHFRDQFFRVDWAFTTRD
jgi:hypothetical protein